jgi:B-box zinc finger protein
MEALARQWCAEHPDRHSHAVCMSCRKLLCQECTTQWEGINYCRACVGALAAAPVKRSRPVGAFFMIAFSIAMLFALVELAVRMGVFFAGIF